ncbi:MAG: hypothetical protein ACPGYT_08905 [Nitrospirales bacterium]
MIRAWILMCLLTAMCFSPSVQASVLSDVANAMSVGTWEEISTTDLNFDFFHYPGEPARLTTAFMGDAMWDPTSQQVLFLGAGHYSSSQMHRYTESSNAWNKGANPPGAPIGLGHAYYHNSISVNDRIVLYVRINSRRFRLYEYNIDGNSWTTRAETANDGDTAHGFVYFPERRLFYLADGTFGILRVFNRGTNSWSVHATNRNCFALGNTTTTGYYHNFAVYNPIRKEIVFGGGNTSNGANSRAMCTMNESGTITEMPLAPTNLGISSDNNGGGLISIDSSSGDLLVLTQLGQFYAFNFASNQWRTINDSATRPSQFSLTANNTINDFVVPISTYGVMMYVDEKTKKAFLYKHAQGGAGPVPPPPPTDSLSPKPVSMLTVR